LGGDTVWANTVAAYDGLPDTLKALAEKLRAVHGNDFDYAASRVELLHGDISEKYRRQYAAQVIKSEHPVVRIHPETGEKSLLLGHYAQRFVDCNTYDSDRLYEIFQAHITRLENTIRWHWASLAMPPRFVSVNTIFMSRLHELGQQRAGWFRAAHVIGMTFLGAVLATVLFPLHGPVFAFWGAAAIFASNIVVFMLGIGRRGQPAAKPRQAGQRLSLVQLFNSAPARRTAGWEFSIQSLNAYFAFYVVIIVVRYLHLPERTAGFVVAVQGLAFVLTLVTAGPFVIQHPQASRRLGALLVAAGLVGLAASNEAVELCAVAAVLGCGLGLLQIINLTAFAALGETIGFSQAASINALAGPSGGVFGGLIGGLLEPWVAPQTLFLAFIPLFVVLSLTRQHTPPSANS
jgi:hypothetical protein